MCGCCYHIANACAHVYLRLLVGDTCIYCLCSEDACICIADVCVPKCLYLRAAPHSAIQLFVLVVHLACMSCLCFFLVCLSIASGLYVVPSSRTPTHPHKSATLLYARPLLLACMSSTCILFVCLAILPRRALLRRAQRGPQDLARHSPPGEEGRIGLACFALC